jgi:antimicrobial peptide system SdpB family protein
MDDRAKEALTASWTDLKPWTNRYGLARTLLALGTLLTLAFNRPEILFHHGSGSNAPLKCDGVAGLSLYCHVPASDFGWLSAVFCLVLLVIASGWRPRFTALFHWYISLCVFASASITDGGDQVTEVATLLLLPLCLTDARRWHWSPSPVGSLTSRAVAVSTAFVIQLQVAVIYLDACIAKLAVPEWTDGTALYYDFISPYIGAPTLLHSFVYAVGTSPLVALITWSVLVLEFSLGVNLLLPRRARTVVLGIALGFHLAIAIFIGIPTFALAMFAMLLLGVAPLDSSLREVWEDFPRSAARTIRSSRASI